MIIAITGTPATGKTTHAKKLASELNATYLDVRKFWKEASVGYDEKRDCEILDEEKLVAILIKQIQKAKENNESLIIDSHLSHEIPKEYIDKCIVMQTDLKTLRSRLEERGYNEEKIKENMQAEIFQIILEEVKEKGHEYEIVKS